MNLFTVQGVLTVIVGDCPLYAQQRKCQWKFPDEVGESKMVCFMDFLHIEMASQQCVCVWGGRSCWLDLAGSGCSPWQKSSPLVLWYLF